MKREGKGGGIERRGRERSGRNGERGRRLKENNEQIFRSAYTVLRIARRLLRFRNESALQV